MTTCFKVLFWMGVLGVAFALIANFASLPGIIAGAIATLSYLGSKGHLTKAFTDKLFKEES